MTQLLASERREWIAGGGEMGARVRALDWSKTGLGPLDDWPQSLRTIVSICLRSRFPILIWWGPELVTIYNDALRRIIGDKHPAALGQRGAEGWWEVWHILGPMLGSVVVIGESMWSEDQQLDFARNADGGSVEETYFTFSYSPVFDESDGIGGVFCTLTESTPRVFSERRLRTLTELAKYTANVTTADEACLRSSIALEENPSDVPAAFVYLAQADGPPRLAGATGVTFADDRSDRASTADWPIASVLETGQVVSLDPATVGRSMLAMGCRRLAAPHAALALPLGLTGRSRPVGVLIVALAPLLALDDRYRSFLMLVAGHIGTAVMNARALEAAWQRADDLTRLDRAKTAFFSSGTREFRKLVDSSNMESGRAFDGSTPLVPRVAASLAPAKAGVAREVLIVDDNVDAAESLAALLTVLGCSTRTAYDGRSALALMARSRPQLAFIDLDLPGMDGCELATRLREMPGLASMHLVAVTSHGDKGDVERALEAGFDEHLLKTIVGERLVDLLERTAVPAGSRPSA